ncbi:MAG: hypothetical protein HZA03_02590 [Nitrospinae bacterium]|nr:hypothetical protein [Nitrospinota bacterium]
MKRIYSPAANQRGAALVLALLVMMVLAVFSTVAIMSATQGLRISGKYKTQQQAVYTSDGGAEFASGLIRDTIGNKKLVSATYLSTVNTTNTAGDATTDFEKEIAGINGNIQNTWTSLSGSAVTGVNPDSTANANATVSIMGDTASIDIDFTLSKLTPGSSTEFAARYEGIGSGTAGSVQLLYQVDTYSKIADTEKTVRATYKCVEGGGRCL